MRVEQDGPGEERLRAAIPRGLKDDHPFDRLRTGFAGALRLTGIPMRSPPAESANYSAVAGDGAC